MKPSSIQSKKTLYYSLSLFVNDVSACFGVSFGLKKQKSVLETFLNTTP